MKLIIDIPEETYEYWMNHKAEHVLAEAIANGIRLPLRETVPADAIIEKSTVVIKPTQELINEIKKEKNNMEKGCTSCPYVGHIELKECAYAYTEDAKDCGLYSHEEIEADTTCDTCIHSSETDGSNCYECVKEIQDNFEAKE